MDEKQRASLEALDRSIAKAPLSRAEHLGAQNLLLFIETELVDLQEFRQKRAAEKAAKKEETPTKPQEPTKGN